MFSLSSQRSVKIPYNTLSLRLRRYEPFTRVNGMCGCAVSPSEFYLYIRTDTQIYAQKWEMADQDEADAKENRENEENSTNDDYEDKNIAHTYMRDEGDNDKQNFVPISTRKLIYAIENRETDYEVDIRTVRSLREWFRETLKTPLTL